MSSAKPEVSPDSATLDKQAIAAHPRTSAWVSANAGSGKTYVLATRVIRLLLDGVDPSKLLCLTFTKTAAAEMKTRVFERLATWVTMDEAKLRDALEKTDGQRPNSQKLRLARTLFASALEAPGGLKIQTIHAFCEALLHRFPLEANIAGHFELLDDVRANALMSRARQFVLAGADRPEHLIAAVNDVLSEKGESTFNELLSAIVKNRRELEDFLASHPDQERRREVYLRGFGLGADETEQSIVQRAWPLDWFTDANLSQLEAHEAGQKRATIKKMVAAIRAASLTVDPDARFEALKKQFLKGSVDKGYEPATKNLFPDDIVAAIPDYQPAHTRVALHMISLQDAVTKLEEVDQTQRMLLIAQALIGRYEALKRAQGFLDFDDLIARTASMLKRAGSGAWVRYKLDQGIDHILVDEAQDTSPLQWDVVRTFADEFFDGEAARPINRTVFAVGDEKQSIFSFQGADPAGFSDARDHFNRKVGGAQKPFEPVALNRSFRSTGNVLAAVDHVFDMEENAAGLTQHGDYQAHTALRTDSNGHVVVWDVHTSEDEPDLPEDWAEPIDRPARGARTLAERIAVQISDWLNGKDTLAVQGGRAASAGDILILVRKRGPFVGELSRALKFHNVPVAGADRLTLTSHIAVLDLLALGRCLLNPHDELSLASVLKSPLFGLNDDDLMDLCIGREAQTLWQQLSNSPQASHQAAFEELAALQRDIGQRSAFEFYAEVLSARAGREKLIARLNPETPDILDEFIAAAEAFERDGAGHLHLFIDHIERQAPEIRREMEQSADAVRIMTVHGAKGLEAPVVFLVDDCTAPHNAQQMDKIVTVPPDALVDPGASALPVWNRGRPRSSIMDGVADAARVSDEEEYRRLLYVGMTRAADALFVVGHTTKSEKPGLDDLRWHTMVWRALEPHAEHVETEAGPMLAFPNAARTSPLDTTEAGSQDEDENAPIASEHLAKVKERAAYEPPPKRPLIPSGATSFAIEASRPVAASDDSRPSSLLSDIATSATGSAMAAADRGNALHTLLQMLPDMAPAERETLARSWLQRRGFDGDAQSALLAEVHSIMNDPEFAQFFAEGSQAEVQIMGTIPVRGEERGVSGVIDRMSVTHDQVTIIDYKTGQIPPDNAPPDVAITQLALYGALVEKLYPDRDVITHLLYTRGPSMIEVTRTARESALHDLAKV